MTGSLRHYTCGRTSHDTASMFRGAQRGTRTFPSGVFLHQDGDRRVLFDTGYAAGPWNTGWKGALYRRLLPPEVEPADDVALVLERDGVDPASITHVVLSHLHPDHIGGVRRFPDATFVLTAGQLQTLAAPRLREGILDGLLPDWFSDASIRMLTDADFVAIDLQGVPLRAVDLFGDGTYLMVDLPGHARGHVGALVEHRVLLAGDAAWGADLLASVPAMRGVPRAVQHDFPAYRDTAAALARLDAAGIRIVCSHDTPRQRELLS